MNLVLITGSRDWKDYKAIYNRLDREPKGTIVLQGGCKTGADRMAKEAAIALGFMPLTLDANWSADGFAAGPIRNEAMAEIFFKMLTGRPYSAIAFLQKGALNKGTRNCIAALNAVGIVAEEIEG